MGISLKKEPEVLRYKVKCNLPGGINQGDLVEYNPKTKQYIHNKGGIKHVLPWDCKKEAQFFALIQNPKYKISDLLYVPKSGNFKSSRSTIHINCEEDLKVVGISDDLVYTVTRMNGDRVFIPEDKLQPCFQWMFYNSDGILQTLSSRKHPKKQEFCKSIGNYFLNKEQAIEWLSKVQKFKIV